MQHNWEVILEFIPPHEADRVKTIILDNYIDLFDDGDHQVELRDETLRFKEDPLLRFLMVMGQLETNRLALAHARGQLDDASWRRWNRGMGYSLQGYADACRPRDEDSE